jgi:hypothetical protein
MVNQKQLKQKVTNGPMKTDKPGNVQVGSVSDSRNICGSYHMYNVSRFILERQSAKVDVVRTEGNMVKYVINLYGTHPYTFRRRRNKLYWDQEKKYRSEGEVIESKQVDRYEDDHFYLDTPNDTSIDVR